MGLSNIFTDGCVLQAGLETCLWGWAEPLSDVRFDLACDGYPANNRTGTASADGDGFFLVRLPAVSASFDPHVLTCRTGSRIETVSDIVVGEVWLASGQSNMVFGVEGCQGADRMLADAHHPFIRFATARVHPDGGLPAARSVGPQRVFDSPGWQKADDPRHVRGFPYVAYAFALALQACLGVPVGIVVAATGGTTIEAWLPRDAIEGDAALAAHLAATARLVEPGDMNRRGDGNFTQMTVQYNEKIAPIERFRTRGVLWYQGESQVVDEAAQAAESAFHRKALTTLVRTWNAREGADGRPFLMTHITPFNYVTSPIGAALANEAIGHACRDLAGCADEVPTYDIPVDWRIPGNLYSDPIHPVVKAPVGRRLAQAALRRAYGREDAFLAPRFRKADVDGSRLLLAFDDVGDGLRPLAGNTLRGFSICGEDGVHLDADARISGPNLVELTHPCIANPVGAAYAFSNNPVESNLGSSSGLPAVPFRFGCARPAGCEPASWMWCDSLVAWTDHTRWFMGGADLRPLWRPGQVSGTQAVAIRLDRENRTEGEASIRIEYVPDSETGFFIGLSPVVHRVGRRHGLERFDWLTVDIRNPDDRAKAFLGLVATFVDGSIVATGVEVDGAMRDRADLPPSGGFRTYRVPVPGRPSAPPPRQGGTTCGAEAIVLLQFTFGDDREGTLQVDNIRGWIGYPAGQPHPQSDGEVDGPR